jgi:hypothetical protein
MPKFTILLSLTPDDFTCQGKRAATQLVNHLNQVVLSVKMDINKSVLRHSQAKMKGVQAWGSRNVSNCHSFPQPL